MTISLVYDAPHTRRRIDQRQLIANRKGHRAGMHPWPNIQKKCFSDKDFLVANVPGTCPYMRVGNADFTLAARVKVPGTFCIEYVAHRRQTQTAAQ
ncbi:MAG: hypothetical protein U0350_44025 [Caldilineaceae bacterium]